MTKEKIIANMKMSTDTTFARTKTGRMIHAMHISGQGNTNCGVRNASPVRQNLSPFAQLCDKCFILSTEG